MKKIISILAGLLFIVTGIMAQTSIGPRIQRGYGADSVFSYRMVNLNENGSVGLTAWVGSDTLWLYTDTSKATLLFEDTLLLSGPIVSATGSVGIGTTTPELNFHVKQPAILLGDTAAGAGPRFLIDTTLANFGPFTAQLPFIRTGWIGDATVIGFGNGSSFWDADSIGVGSVVIGGINNKATGISATVIGSNTSSAVGANSIILSSNLSTCYDNKSMIAVAGSSTIADNPTGSGSFIIGADSSNVGPYELSGVISGFQDTVLAVHGLALNSSWNKVGGYHQTFTGQYGPLPATMVDSTSGWFSGGYGIVWATGTSDANRTAGFLTTKDNRIAAGRITDPDTELQDSTYAIQAIDGGLYIENGDAILLENVPAYDDDAAAGAAGLTTGTVYQTTGSGAAPLNAAGILMIKQ